MAFTSIEGAELAEVRTAVDQQIVTIEDGGVAGSTAPISSTLVAAGSPGPSIPARPDLGAPLPFVVQRLGRHVWRNAGRGSRNGGGMT